MREPERVGKDPEVERAAVEWIAALRERESMPETTRARLWERLEASIASDDADAETSGDDKSGDDKSGDDKSGAETSGAEVFVLAPSSRRAALPWVGLGLALATAAALALVFGGGGRLVNFGDGPIERVEAPFEHASDSAPLPARARHGGVNAASSGTRVTLEPSPDEPPPSELASPRPPTSSRPDDAPTGARLGPASARAEPPATSSLAAETEALRRVRSELSRGEPARALELLDDHARRFPAGVLVEERAALRVVALCDAGRRADGRAAAGRFLARYPSSALAGRVRAACPAG